MRHEQISPIFAEYEPPADELEAALVTAWEDLLGISPIGRHDNFLALGGHSLLAVQLMVHVRETFGIEVPVKIFFENPTVKGFAEAVVSYHSAAVGED